MARFKYTRNIDGGIFFLCLSSWKYFGTLKAFWSTFNQVDDLLSHRKQTTIFQYIPTSMNQYHNIKLIFITTFWKREKKNLVANTPLVREINGISRSQHAYTNMRGGGKIKRERVILYAQGNMEPLPLAADSSANDLTNRKIFMTETRNFLNHCSRLCFFFFLLEHVLDFSVRYIFDVTWCLYYSYCCLNASIYNWVGGGIQFVQHAVWLSYVEHSINTRYNPVLTRSFDFYCNPFKRYKWMKSNSQITNSST